jgi:hypothetical protein
MTEKTLPPRGPKNPAKPGQLVTYILVDRKPFHHATIEAAKQEREYLQAKTGKQFRLLKVIGCSSDELANGAVEVVRHSKEKTEA